MRLTRDDDRPVSRTDGAPRAEPIPKTPLRFNARARPCGRSRDGEVTERQGKSHARKDPKLLEQTVKLREDINKFAERTRQAEMSKLDLDLELQKVQDAMHANAMEIEREKRAKGVLSKKRRRGAFPTARALNQRVQDEDDQG